MAEQGREPRSPNSITHDQPHPRRGDELRQGGPFGSRDDSGHAPWKPRADQNAPVVGQSPGVMQDKGRRF